MASTANRAKLWTKMIIGGTAMCVGGPALVYYVMPTEEQLINSYNPDLKRRALQNREKRQQDFDDFVNDLKRHSRSDKPIWAAKAEAEDRAREMALQAKKTGEEEAHRLREEIRQQALRGK